METSPTKQYVLTVNAGSSSIKLGLFADQRVASRVAGTSIASTGSSADAIKKLMAWLEANVATTHVAAVGHRIVHGGPRYHTAQQATKEVLADVKNLIAFDPQHLPAELEIVEALQAALPQAQHVLCFDTAFHHNLPTQARTLPIPRHLEAEGIRRYGFHGLSYAYILEELRRVEGEAAANGKVIIAHLGSGASLAALHGGASIDTTMAMTPVSGVPMSTRSGDLDPGLALYLARTQGYDAERFNRMVNLESGLLGISETTADMKLLLETETTDPRAKDAVDIFCYQVKKAIGGFAAALGGLNTLVFTGGMGEAAPKIRARVCEGLEFLGVAIDDSRNQRAERLISPDGAQVGVHVIPTDESVTIARETIELIKDKGNDEPQ